MENQENPHLKGIDFYDQAEIFERYTSRRLDRSESPNDTMEKPVVLELAGELRGKRILDLGCGDGRFGLEALERGAQSYHGIDGSKNMIEMATETVAGSSATVELASLEEWSYPSEAFDLIISRLVLHYISDIDALFRSISNALVPTGRFIFSSEHPVITSSEKRWEGKGKRQDWLVDNYFHSGRRENHWLGGQVVKYHRTIEQYFRGLQAAGLAVAALREAEPQRENFLTQETFERRQRIPLFLIMSADK